MDDNELINDFLKNIPEFTKTAMKYYYQWHPSNPDEQTGMSMAFFEYVNEFVVELLTTMDNAELLKRIFDYFETMAVSEDDLPRWVMSDGVLVRLSDDPEIWSRATSLMGPQTLKMSKEVEGNPGRE